jgi:eukaryotic-like serine/threonine-protein kinase
MARLSRPPRVPPSVPQSWTDPLTEMTADNPAARPVAREVARILRDLSATSPPARTAVADESATRVRTKPMNVAPQMRPQRPEPTRSRQRLIAAGVLAAVLIVAVLVWLLPRGSNVTPGQPAPTTSAGPDRLRQDSARPPKRGAAVSRKLSAMVLTLVLEAGCWRGARRAAAR